MSSEYTNTRSKRHMRLSRYYSWYKGIIPYDFDENEPRLSKYILVSLWNMTSLTCLIAWPKARPALL